MIRPGTLVSCCYEKVYYGIVTSLNDISGDEDKQELISQTHVLEPTFVVRFEENDEYDCLPLSKLSPVRPDDISRLKDDQTFTTYQKKIAQKQLVEQNGVYVISGVPEAAFPCELGNPIPPEVITSTRYHASEVYLSQLFLKNDQTFGKEQILALSCLQNHRAPVFGRYPSVPNYRNYSYFGNKLVRDYGGVYIAHDMPICLLDHVYVDGELIRVERVVKIESNNQLQFLVAGVNIEGIPFIAVPNQIKLAQKQATLQFKTAEPQLYEQLLEVLPLHEFQGTEYLPQLDTDIRFGNNFTNFTGLNLERGTAQLSPATYIDVMTAKFQFVQGKIIPVERAGGAITYTQCKLLNQIYYAFDLAVEITEQVLSAQEVADVVQDVEERFPGASDFCAADVQLCAQTVHVQARRQCRCCFCGECCGEDGVAFVYGLPLLKRPVFQATFNPPILACFHRSCLEHTPEIQIQDYIIRGEAEARFERPSEAEEPIVRLLIYNRYMRMATMQLQRLCYDNIRDATKPDRISLRCRLCGRPGAVIGCFDKHCTYTGHYRCLTADGCTFNGKEFYCKQHTRRGAIKSE